MSTARDSEPESTDHLNGWKDIAAHLGKSVRSVQRWERKLGLPVHRIGQIVFCSKKDIDAWLARQSEPP